MLRSDPLDILLQHNAWANGQMLAACVPLAPAIFQQSFDIGMGSLHNNFVHILASTRAWGDLLAGREQRPRFDDGTHNFEVDQLRTQLAEIDQEFICVALRHPTSEVLSGTRGGRPYSFTRGGVITHVTTHAMHHRAQCLNMLRQLGVQPLPPSSVVEWMLMVNRPE